MTQSIKQLIAGQLPVQSWGWRLKSVKDRDYFRCNRGKDTSGLVKLAGFSDANSNEKERLFFFYWIPSFYSFWLLSAGEMARRNQSLLTHVSNLSFLAVFAELVPAEETEQDKEHTCETLLMCIVTVLSHGLRSGGGVGDVLRKPSKEVAAPQGKEEQGAGWVVRAQSSGLSVN